MADEGLYGVAANADAMQVGELIGHLGELGEVEVTVDIAGTLVDVCRASYNPERDKVILSLHPDDLDDVLRKLLRITSRIDRADE